MKTATHSCGKTWVQVGNATSHCAACHETFSSTQGFDAHRVDTMTGRGCTVPASRSKRDGSPMFRAVPDALGGITWEYQTGVRERFSA